MAAALAVAIHEVVAGLIPSYYRRAPAREIITHVRIAAIAAARPRPRPTLAPRVFFSVKPKPLVRKIARSTAARSGARRAAAPRRRIAAVVRATGLRPVWDVAGKPAFGAGGNRDRLAAAGGAGLGSGDAAAGNDAATSGTQPCGYVTFSDPNGSQYDARTRGFWVAIRMSVHFADGSDQSLILDYPWYYPNEAANPWSDQNLRDPDFPTRFQSPPPDRTANEPPLVHYVAAHSTPDGMTLLKGCPAAS